MSEQSGAFVAQHKRQAVRRRNIRMLIALAIIVLLGVAIIDWVSGNDSVLKQTAFGSGSLQITSEPAGADVLIDGSMVGKTPLTMDAHLTGDYTLQVRHPYHPTHVEPLKITRGSEVSRTIRLEPASGAISLASNPVGAEVTINGNKLDQVTPLKLADFPTGNHSVQFYIFGRKLITQDLEVFPDTEAELVVELNRLDASGLTVNTKPNWAAVKILNVPVTYSPGVRVPTGEYQIEVKATGYTTKVITRKLRVGPNTIDVTLERARAMLSISTSPANASVTVRVGNDASFAPYKKDMTLLTGPVEIRVQQTGYRSRVKNIDLSPSGRRLTINLDKITAVAGEHIVDPFRDGSGAAPEVIVVREGSITSPRGGNVRVDDPYALGVTEVTMGQYRQFAEATGTRLPTFKGPTNDNHPVAKISWANAVAYTRWLTQQTGNLYRLPTENEWAFAAYSGAGAGGPCETGNIADLSLKKIFREWQVTDCDDGHIRSAPVGSFSPDKLGFYDLAGNVSEWTQDCGRSGCDSHRVRGSSWDSTGDASGVEYRDSAFDAGDTRGFRVVREL
jgi:hypothetical protein